MERKTVSKVKENLQKADTSSIVRLPFKGDTRPSVNYRTARGQLNTLAQQTSCDNTFFTQYDGVIDDYLHRDFIEEIQDDRVEGHYLLHHPVFKRSTTTPLHIVFNVSSKPAGRKSLNDCLLTGPTLTAKSHEISLSFKKESLLVPRTYQSCFIVSRSMNKIMITSNSYGSGQQRINEHINVQIQSSDVRCDLLTVSLTRNSTHALY